MVDEFFQVASRSLRVESQGLGLGWFAGKENFHLATQSQHGLHKVSTIDSLKTRVFDQQKVAAAQFH